MARCSSKVSRRWLAAPSDCQDESGIIQIETASQRGLLVSPHTYDIGARGRARRRGRIVVLNRWRISCPSCFDAEAERTGVKYTFANLVAVSWADRPPPRNP